MGRANRWFLMVAGCVLCGYGLGCVVLPWPAADKLDEIAAAIQAKLDQADRDLAEAATALAASGLTGEQARASLSALCAGQANVVDCATIDLDGILVTVEPEEYRSAEGADVSDQAQVIAVQQTGQPVVSELFTAVEGFPAIDIEYPVKQENQTIGSVSLLFKPADYLGQLIAPLIAGSDYLCMVVQDDGVILYDMDPEQVGKDTFNDPMFADYPSLLAFAQQYLSTTSGTGTYTFKDSQTGQDVTKYARWSTVTLYGTSWRVILITEG